MLITRTPLRVSLFGGGTDFPSYYEKNGGCVLTTAINKYIYVIIKPRIDNNVRVSYTHIETTHYFAKLKHELVREAIRLTGMPSGVEIITIGDVPAGMGLGSSSTVLVGLLKAMHTYCHNEVSDEIIAQEACTIERDVLNKPIGIQDQYIAAYGGLRFIQFSDEGVVVSEDLSEHRSPLQDRLMLFSTGVSRKSSDILTEQERKIAKNSHLLNEIRDIAYSAMKKVSEASYDDVGHLMDSNWKIKRKLASHITNPKVDELYEQAKKLGALGGKIVGAGGGGFLLIYSPLDKKDAIRSIFKEWKELPFSFEPEGTKVIFND
jgi:D-glycero-alpha-D-manno-heptose-7-phosphate kinase